MPRITMHDVARRAGVSQPLEIGWYSSDGKRINGAHMAPCPAGENDVALAPGYAANIEVASADPQPVAPIDLDGDLHTPGATTIAAECTVLPKTLPNWRTQVT